MQVTKITEMPVLRVVSNTNLITQETLQREMNYWRSEKILKKMLDEGKVSDQEFNNIRIKNRTSFSPMLAKLMP